MALRPLDMILVNHPVSIAPAPGFPGLHRGQTTLRTLLLTTDSRNATELPRSHSEILFQKRADFGEAYIRASAHLFEGSLLLAEIPRSEARKTVPLEWGGNRRTSKLARRRHRQCPCTTRQTEHTNNEKHYLTRRLPRAPAGYGYCHASAYLACLHLKLSTENILRKAQSTWATKRKLRQSLRRPRLPTGACRRG